MAAGHLSAQTLVTGSVSDGRGPLAGANVFIMGMVDGCLTDSLGRFSFTTSAVGKATLKVTLLGYDDYATTANVEELTGLTVRMHERAATINEVVVIASTFSFGKSDNFKTMSAHDVVMAGNSCGDIVAALQTLPGTQKVGEDGKLYVRGGESSECQTFVNGMHVLMPYTTGTPNNAVRGRFSPFLFKGINFSLGGYGSEYGQALSSVLPMETTDVATSDKYGVSASLVDWNVGGTKVFGNSSLSFNGALTSMALYDRLFDDRQDFSRPYRKLSGEAQYKREFNLGSVMKSYVGYDYTSVGQRIDGRNLSLNEHNVYANLTHRAALGHGYTMFAGIAHSSVVSRIDNVQTVGDSYHHIRNEIHLKTEMRKVCSNVLKLSAGVEDYVRLSTLRYDAWHRNLYYNIFAAHAAAQWRVGRKVFLNLSARAENMLHNWLLMPRATLSYLPNRRLQVSVAAGRYSQSPEDSCLAHSSDRFGQSTALHAILSMQYQSATTLLRIEPYWKQYSRLPLLREGLYRPNGYGTSKGIDVMVEDRSLIRNLVTTLSYSFNDSKRLYLDYTERRRPSYASRHNLRLTAKYAIGKCIVGVSETYASSRRFAMGTTPHYNSVDANLTYLLSPKVIVYASLNNIFGRTNIFGYNADGTAIVPSRDRFLYIGIFVSLKNNKAYDISNF